MTVIVFDMDDTLYDEMTYVESGFYAVATYLNSQYGFSVNDSFRIMKDELRTNGRGKIFDSVLHHYKLLNSTNVKKCVGIYRNHTPVIKLSNDAINCLENLVQNYPLYLVTDGNKNVQSKKVKALELEKYMKFCFISHRYGISHAKPSPYIFNKICERENTTANQVIYIGDNPNKDFVGIKKLGFRTVRIMRGSFSLIEKELDYEADHRISSLNEINSDFINNIINY